MKAAKGTTPKKSAAPNPVANATTAAVAGKKVDTTAAASREIEPEVILSFHEIFVAETLITFLRSSCRIFLESLLY